MQPERNQSQVAVSKSEEVEALRGSVRRHATAGLAAHEEGKTEEAMGRFEQARSMAVRLLRAERDLAKMRR